MNDVRYEYKYQPLGYELTNTNNNEKPEEEQASIGENQVYENTNFLNLPKDFKLGG